MVGVFLLGRTVFEKSTAQAAALCFTRQPVYRYADALVAVSQTYLDRAKETNPNVPGEVIYIGADFPKLDAAPAKDFGDDKTRFFYLGTLSYSYDVETVCKGVRKLLDDGENVELHIMGGEYRWTGSNNMPATASSFTATFLTPK